MNIVERVQREIEALHAFFSRWYASSAAGDLEDVSSVLAPDFELLSPSGELLTRQRLLEELKADRGAFPDLTISVEGMHVLPSLGDQISVRYIEVHWEAGTCERRECCALLRRCAHARYGLEWVAIDERHEV